MNNKSDIVSKLKVARKTAVKEANNAFKKRLFINQRDWQNKEQYLTSLIEEFEDLDIGPSNLDSIFVSFSKRNGEAFYEILSDKLSEYEFEVINGFQDSEDEKEDLIGNVLSQIKKSSFYVGILTKEIVLDINDDEQNSYAPSIWTMEEKGMAFGLGKPFLLLIENGIHKDFWRKTSPQNRHIFFNDYKDFKSKLDRISDRIVTKIFKENFKDDKGF